MTGIIVLCRYNSSRLPGKILKEINGKPILKYIVEKLSNFKKNYQIVIATSINETDNPIAKYCKKNGITCFRGDLNDVSKRFLKCAETFNFDYAVRINGDNLFLDCNILRESLKIIETNNIKFLSNVKERTFPKGVSVEIVNVNYYKDSISSFSDEDKEHVMTYFYRLENKNHFYIYSDDLLSNYGKYNLAIDTLADFKKANNILRMMNKKHIQYNYKEIVKLLKKVDK